MDCIVSVSYILSINSTQNSSYTGSDYICYIIDFFFLNSVFVRNTGL